MQEKFFVTEAAGRDVAGQRNPGVDMPILLTAEQSEHPLRLGHIRRPDPLDRDGDGKRGGSRPKKAAEA